MNKTKIEPNKIVAINEEFLGKDKSKNYLKHDFRRVLECFIQREVLLGVILECSKKRHDKKESKNELGEVVSVAFGDYDPDNGVFLHSIFQNHELGAMINMRLLLTKKETGAGGKFVKDVTKLRTEDFIEYYKYGKEDKIIIPPLLSGRLLKDYENSSCVYGDDFINTHKDVVEKTVKELVKKAKTFNSRNYLGSIIKNYEALKFHKDNHPEKYEASVEQENIGALSFTKNIRKDKAKVETVKVYEALNEFAEIIKLYQKLVGENTSFYGSNWPLDAHIQRTFALFSKDIPDDDRQSVVNNLAKHLKSALNVAGWRIATN